MFVYFKQVGLIVEFWACRFGLKSRKSLERGKQGCFCECGVVEK